MREESNVEPPPTAFISFLIKMDINENPSMGQDPKVYVMSQSGNIYYFFRSQITTGDKRYTLIS